MLQVVLPGLYWPHYYLLPVPGLALVLAIYLGDLVAEYRAIRTRTAANPLRIWVVRSGTEPDDLGDSATMTFLQFRDYLRVPPEELTIRYNGRRQWVVLRQMGRELARRKAIWRDPHLFIWGWQSPLYFYGKLDSHPRRNAFTDNLLLLAIRRAENTPSSSPGHLGRLSRRSRVKKPQLIFTGYPPFPSSMRSSKRQYLPSRLSRGLWVDREDYGPFETFEIAR